MNAVRHGRTATLAGVLFTALSSSPVAAGNLDTYFIGNTSAMMAGAITAATRDAEALWYNPAGLALAGVDGRPPHVTRSQRHRARAPLPSPRRDPRDRSEPRSIGGHRSSAHRQAIAGRLLVRHRPRPRHGVSSRCQPSSSKVEKRKVSEFVSS